MSAGWSYGPDCPFERQDSMNYHDPLWKDLCRKCGFTRSNVRHGPPPRPKAVVPPDECRFEKRIATDG